MTFLGMDTEAARAHADALTTAAGRLEDLIGSVDSSVQSVTWEGPDADAFRDIWGTARHRALDLPSTFSDRSADLRTQADEQDAVSEDSGAGDGGGFFDWLGDAAADFIDGVGDFFDGVGDFFEDAWDSATDLAGDVWDGITDYADGVWGNLGEIWDSGTGLLGIASDAVMKGEWPRWTELVAGTADLGLDVVNAAFHLVSGHDLHLADDGTGYADAPVPVSAEDSGLVTPSSLADIVQNTNATYGDAATGEVSMTVVGNPPTGVIVNIPGTEQWAPFAGDNPMDLTGNAGQAGPNGWSAGAEATADAIAQLYAEQGIPPGTPVMLNGHSQGGMIATSLAADADFTSQFNVTNVMTYGSPVDNYSVDPGIEQLNIQHASDIVPVIDMDGAYAVPVGPNGIPVPGPNLQEILQNQNIGAGNTVTATLPSPGGPFDVMGNHSQDNYQTSVATQLQDPDSQLSQYSQDPSLDPFLTDDPTLVQQFISGVHRDN